jgi:hypothetical protein
MVYANYERRKVKHMPESKKGVPSQPDSEQESPHEFYTNSVQINMGPFDMFLDFSNRTPEHPTPKPSARIYTSIQHAWVMAKIMDRLFAQYRQGGGTITIPDQVLNELGLIEEYREDWGK